MGARLAVDDVNNAGGIKSMGGAKLKLIEYDTQDSAGESQGCGSTHGSAGA